MMMEDRDWGRHDSPYFNRQPYLRTEETPPPFCRKGDHKWIRQRAWWKFFRKVTWCQTCGQSAFMLNILHSIQEGVKRQEQEAVKEFTEKGFIGRRRKML